MSLLDRLIARRGSRTIGLRPPGSDPLRRRPIVPADVNDLQRLAEDLGIGYEDKALARDAVRFDPRDTE
jgi:hypothetical protein